MHPDEEHLLVPDFVADESDRFWSLSDSAVHRPCFLVWDQRRAFIARFNRLARRLRDETGAYPHMTSEGDIVTRWPGPAPS